MSLFQRLLNGVSAGSGPPASNLVYWLDASDTTPGVWQQETLNGINKWVGMNKAENSVNFGRYICQSASSTISDIGFFTPGGPYSWPTYQATACILGISPSSMTGGEAFTDWDPLIDDRDALSEPSNHTMAVYTVCSYSSVLFGAGDSIYVAGSNNLQRTLRTRSLGGNINPSAFSGSFINALNNAPAPGTTGRLLQILYTNPATPLARYFIGNVEQGTNASGASQWQYLSNGGLRLLEIVNNAAWSVAWDETVAYLGGGVVRDSATDLAVRAYLTGKYSGL